MEIMHIRYSLCIGLLAAGIIFSVNDVYARKGSSASGAIDAKTFEVMTKAQSLTEEGSFDEALGLLDSIKNSNKLKNNSYAKSQIWNFYAYIYASQDKYRDAISMYEKVLSEKGATEGLKLQSQYTIAQLYFQIEDYDAVIKFMREWLKAVKAPTSTAYIMLAQAYYEKREFDDALQYLDNAIRFHEDEENKKVAENWLRMKAAIHFAKEDTANTLSTYLQLFKLYPKVEYLKQIAGLYGEVDKNKERLVTYDAIYQHGALKSESEVLNLAYMYIGQEAPFKAGRIIEEGMQKGVVKRTQANMETLANAWAQANEHKKAIPTLEKAAKQSDDGMLYARLAGVLFDSGDFKEASTAARTAAQKGGLKQAGNNQMLLGMSLFNIKNYEGALQAFRGAKEYKKNFNDAAKWEKYTLSELTRLRQLESSKIKLLQATGEAVKAELESIDSFGKNILKPSAQPSKDSKEPSNK